MLHAKFCKTILKGFHGLYRLSRSKFVSVITPSTTVHDRKPKKPSIICIVVSKVSSTISVLPLVNSKYFPPAFISQLLVDLQVIDSATGNKQAKACSKSRTLISDTTPTGLKVRISRQYLWLLLYKTTAWIEGRDCEPCVIEGVAQSKLPPPPHGDINTSVRFTQQIHQHWSPTNYEDSTVPYFKHIRFSWMCWWTMS